MRHFEIPEEMPDIIGGVIAVELLGATAIFFALCWKYGAAIHWPLG